MIKSLATLVFIFVGAAHADQIQLSNVTEGELKSVVKEFSANFNHTSVSGANTLGHIYGFEVGLIGGVTKTPDLETLVHSADPSTTINEIPNAVLLGALSIPFGLTIETNIMPKVGPADLKYSVMSLAAKWTITELFFPDLPFSLAVKGQYTRATVEGSTVIVGNPATLTYSNNIYGLTGFISKDFEIVEPYAAFGFLSGSGYLSTSVGSVFDPSFTSASSASTSVGGTIFMLGTELKLGFFKLGAEYAHALGANRYSAKMSCYF